MAVPVCRDCLTTTLPANFLPERKVDLDGYNMTIMILNNVHYSRLWLFGSDTTEDEAQHQQKRRGTDEIGVISNRRRGFRDCHVSSEASSCWLQRP